MFTNCLTVLLAVFATLAAIVSASDGYYRVNEKRDFDREFMHFGKRAAVSEYDRAFMPFGKRAVDVDSEAFDRSFMPFGKRSALSLEQLIAKKNFNRDFMHFGKRVPQFDRDFMHFGKRR